MTLYSELDIVDKVFYVILTVKKFKLSLIIRRLLEKFLQSSTSSGANVLLLSYP